MPTSSWPPHKRPKKSALKHDPAKKYKLYYCSRTAEMTAFLEELSAPEYSGKVMIRWGPDRDESLWFKRKDAADYWDGEAD